MLTWESNSGGGEGDLSGRRLSSSANESAFSILPFIGLVSRCFPHMLKNILAGNLFQFLFNFM